MLGGIDQANQDLDLVTRGLHVVPRQDGLRTAALGNGYTLVVRPFSSGGRNTLEVQTPPGELTIKVRY